jgi:hypothetical protein
MKKGVSCCIWRCIVRRLRLYVIDMMPSRYLQFVYKDISENESHGVSPFKLISGALLRGPMNEDEAFLGSWVEPFVIAYETSSNPWSKLVRLFEPVSRKVSWSRFKRSFYSNI